MERVEKLENSTEESLGIEETVCMKKCSLELERPYPSPKGKEKAYKLDEIGFHGRESEGNIVPIMTVQENAVYGKVPDVTHACREGKSERMSCR